MGFDIIMYIKHSEYLMSSKHLKMVIDACGVLYVSNITGEPDSQEINCLSRNI